MSVRSKDWPMRGKDGEGLDESLTVALWLGGDQKSPENLVKLQTRVSESSYFMSSPGDSRTH